MTKYCVKCNTLKEISEFSKNSGRSDGVNGYCKPCYQLLAKEWRRNNIEYDRKRCRNWHSTNKEASRTNSKLWRSRNPNAVKEYSAEWIKSHKFNKAANEAKRRARESVCFGQNGIREFYENCPKGYEVDHIIPLCGEKVSGLHVIWNLQYLPASENRKKSNTFTGEK
jgi:hypothetical protein